MSGHRPKLHHGTPPWVSSSGETFFVTICATDRANARLTRPETARVLLDAASSYHPRRWWCHIWLVMPDHVHGLIAIPTGETVAKVAADWKRFTARKAGVVWQANFFDHRLRSHESLAEKAAYIRANPIRAGLVAQSADWVWQWEPEAMARPIT